MYLCFSSLAQTNSNPFGFEDGTVGGWIGGGSTESAVTNTSVGNVRTGAYSLMAATTSTSSNKYWYTNNFYGASASGGTYVHHVYWVKTADPGVSMDGSMRYTTSAPPSGTGSTANGTVVALTANTWTQVSYSAGNTNGRFYFPAPRRTAGGATTLYIDDGIIYVSSSSTADLIDPLTPGAVTAVAAGGNVNLNWTSNTDAGTGVQATIILRTANAAAPIPDLNDQGVYSANGGADGPATIGDWTVISATTAAGATTFTNSSVASGTYKYAVILRDLAYNYSVASVSSPVMVGSSTTPVITVNQMAFNGAFGNVVTGIFSTPSSFSVTAADLSANLTITAPAGFQVSTNSTSGYGTTVTLNPVSGNIAATTIYARYAPSAATGASGSLLITNASTGATTQNVTVSGNALAAEPSSAGTITFGTLTSNSVVINLPTIGNGSKRMIIAKQGIAPTFIPVDGTSVSGVNANFTTATDQGGANKIVYNGTGSGAAVVTVSGLTPGTLYHFNVVEYNEGTGTSQNYLPTPLATASTTTPGLPSPAIIINQAGFTGAFGNVVTGLVSATQQYSVSGTNLTNDIVLTAPTGFNISIAATSGFTNTLSLSQTSGTVAATTIYVTYNPAAATGATGTISITHTSTGATSQNVSVSGNALASEPSTAGTITFGTTTLNSIVLNLPTIGNGTKRIIVARAASAVSFLPTDAVAVTGVNANFTTATDQGTGNKIVYDGNGSGSAVVTVTGLASGTIYHFAVYEYNEGTGTSQNYLTSPIATNNIATVTPTPLVILVTTGFGGTFGNVVMLTNSAVQQFTVSGTNLTGGITITAPAGFQVSTSATAGFGATLTLSPVSGAVATTNIYVRYSPPTATGATGNVTISIASPGVTTQTATVSGNALTVQPTTAGTISFSSVASGSLNINLPTVGNGVKRIVVARQGSAPTFVPVDGVAPSGVSANFPTATDQGGGDKIVYDGAGVGSNVVLLNGLTPNTAYYFVVYEYNVNSGTSQNYLATPTATGNTTTLNLVPLIVVNQSGFTPAFGNVVMGTNSAIQQYSVSGTGLAADIVVTAPTSFSVSTSAVSGFASALTLPQTGGTVFATIIYVRYNPALDNGATGTLNITHTSTGAPTQNVAVNGNAISVQPTNIGTITFGNVDDTTIVVNLPTKGNGMRRCIVANLGSPAGFVPQDGTAISGVHANYTLATPQPGDGRIIFDDTASVLNVVKMNGLTPGMLYYFTVYEYNVGTGSSQNYLTNPAAGNNMTTSVFVPNSVQNSPLAGLIRYYPNPAKDMIYVEAPVILGLRLIDMMGRTILHIEHVKQVDVSKLSAGYYHLEFTDGQGKLIKTGRVLKVD